MNIWRFLKRRMLRYKDKIAFADCNITYEELIRLVEKVKCLVKIYPCIIY